ncbi:hypothetical protein [Puerhibacterium puerhi]|uniref:hypothetical protein n=1 Tax=Puerhibacterium puerhi TaxID=2692623 RepID=UPI00135A2ACF|nr:hypothetical protein [Puerhibacterium puerhi]
MIAQSAWAPRTPWDENGVFQLARVFAGEDDVPVMLTQGYYPGASALIAPVYWFTDDPRVAYTWANFLTNVVAVATLLPLTGIVRRVGLSLPQAITVSALSLMLPAYAGLNDYVLAEQLLTLLIVLTAYAVMRFWSAPGLANGALLLVSALAALITHPRALVLIGVLAIWLIGLLYDKARRRSAAVVLVALVPIAYGAKELADHLASLVLFSSFSQGGALFETLTDPDVVMLLKTTFLQSWAQLVGTLGILAFGAVVLLVWAWNELVRGRRFGPGVFLLGLAFGGSVLSWIAWANPSSHDYSGEPRFDSWVYTRYIAPFVLVAIALGLSALLLRLSWAMAATSVAATVVLSLVVVYVFADTVPLWGSTYGPANIVALRAWESMWPTTPFEIPLTPTLTDANRFWVLASLAVVGSQIAMALVSRVPILLSAALVPALFLYANASDENLPREAPVHMERGLDAIEDAEGGELAAVSFDMDCDPGRITIIGPRATTLNWIGFWFSPRDVDVFHADAERPESDVVVACEGWADADALGAEPVKGTGDYGYQLYVVRGELQDQLRADGLVGAGAAAP